MFASIIGAITAKPSVIDSGFACSLVGILLIQGGPALAALAVSYFA